MIFLAFIAGAFASRWLETLLTRVALKIVKDPKWNAKIQRHANQENLNVPSKGKIISLKGLDAANILEKGGTLEEMLDAQEHGSDLQQE